MPQVRMDQFYQEPRHISATSLRPSHTGTNWYQCTKAHDDSMHKTSNRGSTAQPAANSSTTTENNSTRSTRFSPAPQPTRPGVRRKDITRKAKGFQRQLRCCAGRFSGQSGTKREGRKRRSQHTARLIDWVIK
jgi:hypothetical protein